MDWLQVMVLVFGNAAWTIPLWLWNRAESRADNRQMLAMMQGLQQSTSVQIAAIQQEIKDFHGRLERQDAEFKAHLHYHNGIQEGNKK